jgi:hypothetical protein
MSLGGLRAEDAWDGSHFHRHEVVGVFTGEAANL